MMHEDTRLPAMRLPIRTLAGGAINTSVADLANWMRLHLGKGEFDGERLLPAALIGELHAPRVYNTVAGLRGVRRSALWPRLPIARAIAATGWFRTAAAGPAGAR